MRLAELAPEVLDAIASLVCGEYVTKLWLSGSIVMRTKLEHGGGVRSWYSKGNLFVPPIISSLQRLSSIRIDGPTTSPKPFSVNVSILPPTVTHMELHFSGVRLVSSGGSNLDALPNLRSLIIGKDTRTQFVVGDMYWPRNLETLILHSSMRLRFLSPSQLPKSLYTFIGIACVLGEGAFPSSLTTLKLGLEHCPPLFVSSLPENLTNLVFWFENLDRDFDDDWWHLLSAKVKTLEAFLPPHRMEGLVARLPPCLDTLIVSPSYMIDESNIHSLPPRLTRLKAVLPRSWNHQMTASVPRTLTDIDVDSSSKVPLDAVPLLPPGLTNLNVTEEGIDQNGDLSGHIDKLNALPLQTLRISGSLCKYSSIQYLRCPIPTLKTLEIALRFDNEELVLNTLLQAQNLTSLTLCYYEDEFDRLVSRLPPSLRNLTCHPQMRISSATRLPSSLTSLQFRPLLVGNDQVLSEFWPESLTKLKFALTDAGTANVLFSTSRLPPNLKSLSVDFKTDLESEFYRYILATLPKSLTTLEIINPWWKTTPSDLMSLPTGITSLSLPPSQDMTSDFIDNLPQQLVSITFGGKTKRGP